MLVARLRRQRSRGTGCARRGPTDLVPERRDTSSALPPPRSTAGRAGLAALLRDPSRALIALDFDGTLAPIVATRRRRARSPGAVAALRRLAPLAGTLAVITGRPALSRGRVRGPGRGARHHRAGPVRPAALAGGPLTSPPAPPGLADARRQLPAVLAAAGAPDGTWTEDKGDALAVHTRRAAEPQQRPGAAARARWPISPSGPVSRWSRAGW